jgi:hypothetical protein
MNETMIYINLSILTRIDDIDRIGEYWILNKSDDSFSMR